MIIMYGTDNLQTVSLTGRVVVFVVHPHALLRKPSSIN